MKVALEQLPDNPHDYIMVVESENPTEEIALDLWYAEFVKRGGFNAGLIDFRTHTGRDITDY